MNSRLLVVSIARFSETEYSSWFDFAERIRESLLCDNWTFALELIARRAGYVGHLPDNFSIDLIDALYRESQKRDLAIASLLVPTELNPIEKDIGYEISAVNGWTDLAVYLHASFIRLKVVSPCDFSGLTIQKTLSEILNYMLDNELRVALTSIESNQDVLERFVSSHQTEFKKNVGMELQIGVRDIEKWISSYRSFQPIISISLNITTPISKECIHNGLRTIEENWGENCPIVMIPVNEPLFC